MTSTNCQRLPRITTNLPNGEEKWLKNIWRKWRPPAADQGSRKYGIMFIDGDSEFEWLNENKNQSQLQQVINSWNSLAEGQVISCFAAMSDSVMALYFRPSKCDRIWQKN